MMLNFQGYVPASLEEWTFIVNYLCSKWHDDIKTSTISNENQQTSSMFNENHAITTTSKTESSLPLSDSESIATSVKDHGYSIHMDAVVRVMIRQLGPGSTVDILNKCDLPDLCLSNQVLQSCLLTALLDRQKRSVNVNTCIGGGIKCMILRMYSCIRSFFH